MKIDLNLTMDILIKLNSEEVKQYLGIKYNADSKENVEMIIWKLLEKSKKITGAALQLKNLEENGVKDWEKYSIYDLYGMNDD